MIVEFSVAPIGKGDSLSEDVSQVLKVVDDSGLDYKFTPMSTIVEGEWDEIMSLVKKCHEEMMSDSPRVITEIKIDDHKGRKSRINGKVKSVEETLGKELKK